MKKQIIFLTLAILLAFTFAKSYSISQAQLDYYPNPDGSVVVVEKITYNLYDGQFTQLYLQKPLDLKITNASGYCINADCKFFEQNYDRKHELVLESNFKNQKITAVFEYRIHDQILAQEDTAQFFYKLWGEQWQKSVDELKATIHLPPSEYEYEFFLHPPTREYAVDTRGAKIEINSTNHPANTYLEINLLLPKSAFDANSLPKAKNYTSKEQIINGEKKYVQNELSMRKLVKFIYFLPLLITCISFIILYFTMGREIPLISTGYQSIYEREVPEQLSPATAGYLISKIATPALITSEILMLMHLGYIKASQKEVEQNFLLFKNKKNSIFFKLKNKSPTNLKPHQILLLNLLKDVQNFANKNSKLTKDGFEHTQIAKYVRSTKSSFILKFNQILSKELDTYLQRKANYIMSAIVVIMLLGQLAIYSFFPCTPNDPLLTFSILSLFVLFFFGISPIIMPQILGKWTKKGRVLEQKCLNFKKYLEHFGSFKHKELNQIKLWEQYLAYATAFGIADKVISQIEKVYPQLETSPSTYAYFATYSALNSSFSSSSSSGGFGGGGGGGGGGGAR